MKSALHALLSPATIAVLGASADPAKLGGRPIRFLQEKKYAGGIYPVNPNRAEIAGLRCYPDVAAIPGEVDLAIVALPAADVAEAIRSLGRKKVPAAIVFSSGFGETGAAGAELERALKLTAREARVRVLGPNNLGLINSFDLVFATFSQFAAGPAPAGPVGFVTQSGAFGTGIAALARRRGIGLGYFVNTGNECDVRFDEIVTEILDDQRIRVVAGYIEGLKDGEGFVRAALHANSAGKPLLVTKVGRSGAGARAAASHTGSLAGEDAVFDGVARQFGVVRARNEEHLLDLAEVFCHCALPPANGGKFGIGIGIVTQSGGAGVLMADRAEELGLAVPVLSPATQAKLKPVVPAFGATGNPVDVTAQFLAEPAILRDAVSIMLDDPAVHIGVIWLQLMDAQVEMLLGIFDEIKATAVKPFIVVWVAASDAALAGLRRRGIAVLRGAEPAIDAIAGLARHAQARARLRDRGDAPRIAEPPLPASGAGTLGTLAGASLLERFGIPFAAVRLATGRDAAIAAAAALGYPVALKIESKNIPHKTEAGGVVLGLQDAQSVGAAYDLIMERSTIASPGAAIDGVIVQKMAVPRDASGVEVVIGIRRDPVFGNVVMAGLGGIFVEVLRDVAFRKAPVSSAEAASMLDDLKGRAILAGVRGRPAVRRAALVDLVCRVSALATALGEHLVEADFNPVIADSAGAVAVDWLIVLQ
jgi:acetyltransferase